MMSWPTMSPEHVGASPQNAQMLHTTLSLVSHLPQLLLSFPQLEPLSCVFLVLYSRLCCRFSSIDPISLYHLYLLFEHTLVNCFSFYTLSSFLFALTSSLDPLRL